jgi:1,4-alpha-glucan branching enzyme
VSIYYDVIAGTLPDNTSQVYIHYGYNGWTNVTDAPMTYTGSGGWWRFDWDIPQGVTVIDFVFQDGLGNWDNNGGIGIDWHIPVFEAGITAVVLEPEVEVPFGAPLRSPVFAELEDTVAVVVSVVVNGTQTAFLQLQVAGVTVAQDSTDTLAYDFVAAEYGTGPQELTVLAFDTAGILDMTSFFIMVNPPPVDAPPPPGIVPGINYIDATTVTLALFAPYKDFVYVLGDFNDWYVDTTYFMHRYQPDPDSTLWWLTIAGLSPGTEYAFQYLVDGDLRIADPYTDKVLDAWNDPYIPSITYPNLKPYPQGLTREPVAVLQTAQQPFTWIYSDTFRRPPQQDLVIYELLLRDFIARHDYQTLRDTLDYLANLGINAIELMPISEFEGNSSWGYNPSFYFAPDKYYGTKHNLKLFIDECHRQGIAVIMDIVLNHSFGQSPLVRLYWDSENHRPAADNPWYNPVSPNPVYSWGYDFNHESPHTQAFVDRVTAYWLTEYRMDGFRFDFTKGFTNTPGEGSGYDASRIAILKRMADHIWDEVDSTAYIILEHFADNNEERELAEYRRGMLLWGNANYNYNEATMGYHDNGKSDFSWGYYGTRGWNVPHLVTYMESHDEERLMFKNLQYGNSSGGYNIQELGTALNRIKLAAAFFLTLPGPKMIWQFGEVGYDVSIEDPCRVCEKPILWNYFREEDRNKLYRTVAALNSLRREHEVFRSDATQVDLWLNHSAGIKRIRLSHTSMNVIIVGNFGVGSHAINPLFYHTGWWYDYFSGDSLYVTDTGALLDLAPGEFRIYTDTLIEPAEPGLLALDDQQVVLPMTLALSQNYPNPFNASTRIDFSVPNESRVSLVIYDLLGKEIKRLVDGTRPPGEYSVVWDGRDKHGRTVASGVYFYVLSTEDRTITKKLLVLK